jgi:hypothetical protein
MGFVAGLFPDAFMFSPKLLGLKLASHRATQQAPNTVAEKWLHLRR